MEMENSLTSIERRILTVLQEGLPRSQTPYKDMAQRIGIEVRELLAVLKDWKKNGKLRRIGAIVNHFKVGLPAGAMVVWQMESDRIVDIGKVFAGFEEVSHAYERRSYENWPYNLYTMVHGKEAEEWLPLLPETRDLLLKQAAGRSGKQPLFVTRTTGRRVGVDMINKIVNRLFKQAGVNNVRPSPHTLRHTYCTLMQAAGCDRISVELLMRHRTQNTTDIYTHISAEQKLELLRPKLERFSPIRLVNGHKPSITGYNR